MSISDRAKQIVKRLWDEEFQGQAFKTVDLKRFAGKCVEAVIKETDADLVVYRDYVHNRENPTGQFVVGGGTRLTNCDCCEMSMIEARTRHGLCLDCLGDEYGKTNG